jgi:hypothetical protein
MITFPSKYQSYTSQLAFWTILRDTPDCRDSAVAPMLQALEQLPAIRTGGCFDSCQVNEHSCFVNATCAECYNALTDPTIRATVGLASVACSATPLATRVDLSVLCDPFPSCTLAKNLCTSAACAGCWQTLQRGNGALAARQCTSPNPLVQAIDHVALSCIGNTQPVCDYWIERCLQSPACAQCIRGVENFQSKESIVAGMLAGSCNAAVNHSENMAVLKSIIFLCPSTVVTPCAAAVASCIALTLTANKECLRCFVNPDSSPGCDALFVTFSISNVCEVCPTEVRTVNKIVLATVTVGAVSAVACLAAVLVILAYSKDEHFLRERIILGLMCANFVYSLANTVPSDELHTGNLSCGQLVLQFSTTRMSRAVWFLGKFTLIFFEIFLVGVSILALKTGKRAVSRRAEITMHSMCVLGGVAALVGFLVRSEAIAQDGYNMREQDMAQRPAYTNLEPNDDENDFHPGFTAAIKFHSARNEYDALLQVS